MYIKRGVYKICNHSLLGPRVSLRMKLCPFVKEADFAMGQLGFRYVQGRPKHRGYIIVVFEKKGLLNEFLSESGLPFSVIKSD